jgi:LPS sulfotransferase NodH
MSTRFVIVGAPRTGSTLLVKTLNTLDDVRCHGELLGPENVRGYEDGFDLENASKQARDTRLQRLLQERNSDPVGFIARALDGHEAAIGFKALYAALLDPRWETVVTMLLRNPATRFIHLRRENGLRRFISEQILLAGGANHSGAGGRGDVTLQVHIDIDAFLRREAELASQQQVLGALLPKPQVLEISYEALAADTAGMVNRVTAFLGLASASADVKPALSKVGAADLRNTVSNYQELRDHPATRTLLLAY